MAASDESNTNDSKTRKRGFAAMSASKQREIARMGGRASHGGNTKKPRMHGKESNAD
jgi:general stress protein YciG